jgi:phosphatidylglycerophosphatase A
LGSAVGLGLVAAAAHLPLGGLALTAVLAGLAGALFVVGVWSAGKAEEFFGRKDPGQVVVDEVMGQVVVFLAASSRFRLTWKWLLAGFVLFRLFDILKPPPLRSMERLPGGWGIMMDDLGAGIYSAVALLLLGVRLK